MLYYFSEKTDKYSIRDKPTRKFLKFCFLIKVPLQKLHHHNHNNSYLIKRYLNYWRKNKMNFDKTINNCIIIFITKKEVHLQKMYFFYILSIYNFIIIHKNYNVYKKSGSKSCLCWYFLLFFFFLNSSIRKSLIIANTSSTIS